MNCLIKRSVFQSCLSLIIVCMSKSVSAKAVHTLTARPLPEYVLIDPEYVLNKVVVIHRHGDRAQISRVLGTAFPENEDLAAKWETLLPTVATNRALLFASNPDDTIEETEDGFVDAEKTLYSGWDHINIPYAQLTQVGAEELIMVGKELRDRYREPLGLPDTIDAAANTIFCRSTNMCRTKQSIRSLLVGLFDVPVPTATSRVAAGDAELHGASSPVTREQLKHLPKILSRERLRETMYPNADGACAAMINRRSVVFPADALETNIPDYAAFEARIKPIFGFDQDNHTKVNWLQVKEVLTCHASHNISMIQEVTGHTDADIDKATEITGWTWGALYKDDILNRLAIGRFLWDMLEDLSAATATVDNPFARVLATHRDKTNSSSSNSIGSTGSSSTSSDIEAEAEAEAEREGGSGGDDAMPTGASLRYLERAPCTISCARCRSSSAGPAAAVRGGGALRLRFEDCALAVLMASIRCPSSSSAKVPSCLYLP
mmetsp:Transcript_5290/g.8615  ORF Transcript_5290/g.8615 Transcript_5290/m.8615 type:complete len:491 (-) Transcript_5290:879-2351(-)